MFAVMVGRSTTAKNVYDELKTTYITDNRGRPCTIVELQSPVHDESDDEVCKG